MRTAIILVALVTFVGSALANDPVRVGFAAVDVTPDVSDDARPVWLAGYGHGRRATGVHDPIYARAVVLVDGQRRVAMVSVDVVGLMRPVVLRVREKLEGFDHVMVASTHSHEGPDVMGLWGPTPTRSGVDHRYIDELVDRIAASVRAAEQNTKPATAVYGTASDPQLLRDSRKPDVRDAVMRVVRFDDAETGKAIGIIVVWSCHPEAMGSKNTLITADFPKWTQDALRARHNCEAVFFAGAVGGLMAPPGGRFKDDAGQPLREGQWVWTQRYGEMVADLADEALGDAKPVTLSPVRVSAQRAQVPLDNPLYMLARAMGVVQRDAYAWTGDWTKRGEPLAGPSPNVRAAIETEVAYLRLGDLHIAGVPGEIYPELLHGEYEDPVQPHVDYPDEPLEPPVYKTLPGKHQLVIGLANDEIGYILPKRQWDFAPPYAYGRGEPQYGEINSVGPDAASVITAALGVAIAEIQ